MALLLASGGGIGLLGALELLGTILSLLALLPADFHSLGMAELNVRKEKGKEKEKEEREKERK